MNSIGESMKARLSILSLAIGILVVTVFPSLSNAYTRPWRTELVSQASSGDAGDADSWDQLSISSEGRFVAFASEAGNFDPRDQNGGRDIFVRDRRTGRTELVSVASDGTIATIEGLISPVLRAISAEPRITPSGRYIAFRSNAALADEDLDAFEDVFVHDRILKTTELVSVPSDDLPMEGRRPAITPDARFVAFEGGTPLVDTTSIFLRDRTMEETRLVSVDLEGEPVLASAPSISANGRFIVFTSNASNLVESEVPVVGNHVYVRDMKTQTTELVSRDVDGAPANSPATRGSITYFGTDHISSDGRYVLFSSHADRIVPNDGRTIASYPELVDIFVLDRKTQRMQRVTVDSMGRDLGGNLESPSLSPDGRFVVFKREQAQRSETKPNGCVDSCHGLYVHDLKTGATEPVGPMLDSEVRMPVLSAEGRYVAFAGIEDTWFDSDTNGFSDIFLHDRGAQLAVGQLAANGQAKRLSLDGAPAFSRTGTTFIHDIATDARGSKFGAAGELIGARITYRPALDDIFVVEELKDMPSLTSNMGAVLPSIMYGFRFEAGGRSFEVRATSLLGGMFELYECSNTFPGCAKVGDLLGGFGTTGERVVFSLPLASVGLEDDGELSDVEAFSSIGTNLTGPTQVFDTARLN